MRTLAVVQNPYDDLTRTLGDESLFRAESRGSLPGV